MLVPRHTPWLQTQDEMMAHKILDPQSHKRSPLLVFLPILGLPCDAARLYMYAAPRWMDGLRWKSRAKRG